MMMSNQILLKMLWFCNFYHFFYPDPNKGSSNDLTFLLLRCKVFLNQILMEEKNETYV